MTEAAIAPPKPVTDKTISESLSSTATLPTGIGDAMLRGAKGQCPRCGEAKLFRKFLKPIDTCPACHQDWTHQRADDFPAYVAILIAGHFIGFLLVELDHMKLSAGTIAAITVSVAIALVLSLIQPAKGAIIAMQWWHGLHGFLPGKDAQTVMAENEV